MSLLICVRFPNGRFSSDPHNQHDVCLAIISPWPTHLIQYNRCQISHYEGFHLLYTGLFKKNWTLSKIYYCSVTVVKTGAFCWRKYQFKPYIYIYIFKKKQKTKKNNNIKFFFALSHRRVPKTPANQHLSPPPTNANSGGPTEPKDDEPRPRTLHTNHTHTQPPPYLLRRLQSPHFSTLLHTVISHIYFVRHDDEISTSAIHIIISLLDPTL